MGEADIYQMFDRGAHPQPSAGDSRSGPAPLHSRAGCACHRRKRRRAGRRHPKRTHGSARRGLHRSVRGPRGCPLRGPLHEGRIGGGGSCLVTTGPCARATVERPVLGRGEDNPVGVLLDGRLFVPGPCGAWTVVVPNGTGPEAWTGSGDGAASRSVTRCSARSTRGAQHRHAIAREHAPFLRIGTPDVAADGIRQFHLGPQQPCGVRVRGLGKNPHPAPAS